MVGLTTLETRRLRADMIEVYTILGGFEGIDEVKFFHKRACLETVNLIKHNKKRVNLNPG